MIVLKYTKLDSARYVSHIDLLRQWDRFLRRADVKINYSHGFNPHALVFFSPPISLGVGSVAEYVAIDTEVDCEVVMARVNAAMPQGFRVLKAFCVGKNPNLAARVIASDYSVPLAYDALTIKKPFVMNYVKQGVEISEDVTAKIRRIFKDKDGNLMLRLSSGNDNLRVDRVSNQIAKDNGVEVSIPSIVKTAQYVLDDNADYMDVDEFLSRLAEAKQ